MIDRTGERMKISEEKKRGGERVIGTTLKEVEFVKLNN